jgi:hypothetical protein
MFLKSSMTWLAKKFPSGRLLVARRASSLGLICALSIPAAMADTVAESNVDRWVRFQEFSIDLEQIDMSGDRPFEVAPRFPEPYNREVYKTANSSLDLWSINAGNLMLYSPLMSIVAGPVLSGHLALRSVIGSFVVVYAAGTLSMASFMNGQNGLPERNVRFILKSCRDRLGADAADGLRLLSCVSHAIHKVSRVAIDWHTSGASEMLTRGVEEFFFYNKFYCRGAAASLEAAVEMLKGEGLLRNIWVSKHLIVWQDQQIAHIGNVLTYHAKLESGDSPMAFFIDPLVAPNLLSPMNEWTALNSKSAPPPIKP